jgi:tetratricopeptide (TPR) repeat protein
MAERKNRSGSSRDSISADLKEKHLHSKAAKLLEMGEYNKAIELFKQAIKIQDQSYTRYHCSLAHVKNDQIREAITELGRAIELNPDVPEYFAERSNTLRTIGDGLSAMNDDNMANQLDEDCARIGTIKANMQTVKNSFSGPTWFDGLGKKKIKNQNLREVVRDIVEARNMRQELLNSSSCMLPCPSYCCHFSKETILHGLYIGPWKLHAIRELFREKSLPEGQYIDKISYNGEKYLKELIPPQFIIGEHGKKWIFFPRRQKSKINKEFLKDLPKGSDCQTLVWINENARPCVFLHEGRCIIHDTGGEDGLPSCKEFICLTGFVFVVLKNLGLVNDEELAKRKIGVLNRIAVESLLILAKGLFGHEMVVHHNNTAEELLRQAIESDLSGDERGVTRLVGEYDLARIACEGLMSDLIQNIRTAIKLLFVERGTRMSFPG